MFRFGRKKSQEPQDSYTNPPDENKRGNGLSFLVGRGTNAKSGAPAVIEPDSGDERSASQNPKVQSNRSNDNNKHDDASYASSLTSQSHSRTRPHDSYQSGSHRIVEEEDSGAGLSAEEKFMTYFQQKRASESASQSRLQNSQPKMETAALSTHVDVSDDDDVYSSGDHLAMMAAAARKDEDQKRKEREEEEARKLKQRQLLQQEETSRLQQRAEEERLQNEQQTAAESGGGQLTEEQRRAKARQAVEDRKRKAREAVEARKAKARQANAQNLTGDGETQESPDAGDGQMLVDTSKQSDEALREKQRLMEEAEAARKAQQEKERLEREQAELALQEKLRQEEEDLRRQQEELREEELRLEEEMREAQEKARVEEEFRKLEEEERRLNEEMARLDEEAKEVQDQTQAIRYEQYDMAEEEGTPAIAEDDEDATLDEVQRQAEEWIAAEAQKLVEEAKLAEEAQRAAQEREKEEKLAQEKAAEEARLEQERRDAETRLAVEARLEEERRQAEARIAEEARLEEERRQAEEARIAEEAKLEEERRRAEVARLAEEARLEEERRQAEEARIAEEARLEEERRQVEEARVAAEQLALEQARQVEEARLAVERFADEQYVSQTSPAEDTIDENHEDIDDEDVVETHEEYDMGPDIEPSETDLSALLGGDDDALFDSALDGPPEPASPVKNKSIIRNSFSKFLSGSKNKVSEKKKKENMGLRFYKPKSVGKDISNEKSAAAPVSTKVTETTKVRITPPKPPSAPPTKRIPAPQKSLPPPSRHEPEPPKPESKTPDQTTVAGEETIESVVSHVPEANHKATSLAARGFPTRRGKKALTKSPRGVPQSPARSVDSTGSVASIDRIPRSPYMKIGEDEDPGPSCSNPYYPTLHGIKDACQICVFRLSELDRERFEKNGRSLLVNTTAGGCVDCNVFPSHEGEDPVRICRQCFFNTHLQCKREEEAFAGPGALTGVLHRPRYVNGRPSL